MIRAENQPYILDITTITQAIVAELDAGQSKEIIAASFHQTMIDAFIFMSSEIRKKTGLVRVVLSGGCFQNKILLEGTVDKLRNSGFDVYCHRQVPANDGGISLGQSVVAAAMLKKGMA